MNPHLKKKTALEATLWLYFQSDDVASPCPLPSTSKILIRACDLAETDNAVKVIERYILWRFTALRFRTCLQAQETC